jgi:pimeloyl-ACP methyl ester carboxylesterase
MVKTVTLPHRNGGGIRIRERILDRTETGDVFGIVTEPVEASRWNGQCVVLLNAGSVHHIGPSRMHVQFSRQLAAQGSRVCRADLRGLGDSPAVPGSRDNDPYPATAREDVREIVRALTTDGGCSRIALAGLCSGAWTSFHAGLVLDGITDVILINPDFYGERSVVGKPASFVRPKDYSHYKYAARSWVKWKKLLRGRADISRIMRVLWNEAELRFASFRMARAGQHHQLDDDLTRLAILGLRVGFVFSPGDGGLDFLRRNGRLGLERLSRSGLLREITIDHADHPFSLPGSQRRLGETLSEWLRCDDAGRLARADVKHHAGHPAALPRVGDR